MPEQTSIVLRNPTDTELAAVGAEWAKAITGFGPALPAADRILAAQLKFNGFQPFHFNVIHGHLYLNLDGRTFWAQTSMRGSYGGITIEPLDKAAKEQWGIPSNEAAVKATLWKVSGGQRFPVGQDIGRAGGAKDSGGNRNPIAVANPVEMAIKRATVRVLRSATPLGVDIGTYVQETDEVLDDVPAGDAPAALEAPATVQVLDGVAQGARLVQEGDAEDVEELDWTPDQVSAPAPEQPPAPALTPRVIPASDLSHPFVAALQLALAGVGLWDKAKGWR
jgi:hypothetical protein